MSRAGPEGSREARQAGKDRVCRGGKSSGRYVQPRSSCTSLRVVA